MQLLWRSAATLLYWPSSFLAIAGRRPEGRGDGLRVRGAPRAVRVARLEVRVVQGALGLACASISPTPVATATGGACSECTLLDATSACLGLVDGEGPAAPLAALGATLAGPGGPAAGP